MRVDDLERDDSVVDEAARIETVHAFMRCINRGDHEGALEYLDPEIEVVEPSLMPYAGTYVGHAQFIEMMRAAMKVWRSWKDTPYPYSLACVGNCVYREHRFRAEVRGTGVVVEMHFLEVAEFRGERIARIRPYYFDPLRIKEAVEAPGPA